MPDTNTAVWPLDRQGFVTCYMVSGPKAEPFTSDHRDPQQIRYEGWLRRQLADHEPVADTEHIILGENSRLGLPWRVHYDEGSAFVDCSTFYSLMRKVTFDVAACLLAPRDLEAEVVLWSYAAVDLYCNGVKVGEIDAPVYKPIRHETVRLSLKAGRNILYMACRNLGVRDTRSTVALQLKSHRAELTAVLPDPTHAAEIQAAEAFLHGTRQTAEGLAFPCAAPETAFVLCRRPRRDEDMDIFDPNSLKLGGQTAAALEDGVTYATLCVKAAGATLSRTFERTERILPLYGDTAATVEKNRVDILRRIAEVRSCPRGGGIHFPMAPMLARKALGLETEEDPQLFLYTLDLIEQRIDCSDFMMCGLLRWIKAYGIPAGTEERVRQVLLNYRYWMDMDGFDGMCFWSENHALMFYSSAMLAGELYPDAYFPRAARTGRELSAYGRSLVTQWLDDVEAGGFEEFLSAVYMCVTFAAILNVVDFGPADLSARARRVTDRVLEMLALHTFKDGLIAPMGRVYRGALYPFNSGAMALINLMDPTRPYSFGEGWLGFWANSGYTLPQGMKALMDDPVETTYTTGNARIRLEKNADYCLTSVDSPRTDEGFTRWTNETLLPDADQHTHAYTKSFNERFHGTTCFRPGTYGYQQHMWYAALDGAACVFANHPGSMSENGDLRPGYWHGNGVMPAQRQVHGVLASVYNIPETHPIHYTHLYCPVCRFDEVRRENNWLFLRKGSGYLAVWCSGGFEAFDGMNAGCEWRTYGDAIAYLTVCGGQTDADFDTFIARAKAQTPVFDGTTLSAQAVTVTWQPSDDRTQYL